MESQGLDYVIKKVVQQKCDEVKAREESEENDSLCELLREYGDTPLPEVERQEEEEKKDEHHYNSSAEPSESRVGESETPSACPSKTLKAEDVSESSSSQKEQKDSTVPSAPDFGELQHQLTHIDPYYQAQKQLKELVITDSQLGVPLSKPLHSSGVVNHSVHSGSVVVETQSDILPSVPRLEDIEGHLENGTVLQDGIIDEAVEEPAAKTKITLAEECTIEPMTEIQLSALYQNHELEENEAYVAHFIEHERTTPHLEFYELVLGYLRARTNLIGIQKELSTIQEDYERQKKNIWVFEKRTVTEEGECEDGALLTIKHEYEVACFKEEISEHVSKLLKQTRELLGNSHALHSYEAEMCKLQVENYMQKVLSDCKEFVELPKNALVCASSLKEHHPHLRQHVEKLQSCISVLFAFQRRGVKDHQFVRDSRQWLTDLVAVLLRVATRQDHLFLLNHVLRCPAGVGTWAPSYIQIGGEWQQDIGGGILGCWPLDHSLTVLSTIVQPVSAREDFLHHIRHTALPGGASEGGMGQNGMDNVWVVVDSSGEEEEDPSQLWAAFTENDVIQILNQVPFKEIFQHMLLVQDEEQTGALNYEVTRTSHRGLLKLFAFARCLIDLFRQGLKTFSQVRYRGASKRLCRLLRHTVEYVTDHWQGCLVAHQHNPALDAPQWTSLQVEYDQLFEAAVDSIFSSPRSGAWQFLAVIPYGSVSLTRLWKIVYKLHVGMKKESIEAASKKNTENRTAQEWSELVAHSDTRGQFHDCLLGLEENEGFYLLSALANMTVTREPTENVFIQVVVSNIFEVAFINEGTRESLCRTGRDLLASVASTHPVIMSHLLTTTQEKIMHLGSMALYLFRALPIEVWRPTEEDMTCVSHWLLFMPAASVENQLARVILSKLNWGENEAKTKLVLPQELHQKVALTVLEAHIKICRDLYSGNLLTEGVKHVTAAMYTPAPEKVFFLWSWEMLTHLRLHRLDQPESQVRAALACPASLLVDMPDPTSITITQASLMNIVKRGIMDKKPLALYAALLMTTWGHSLPEICEHGVECMHELVVQGRCEAVIHALGQITPLFFSQPEDLTTNTRFMLAVQKCLAADQSYITLAKSFVSAAPPGKILTLFAAMIVHHIKDHKRYSFVSGASAVRFWLQLLIGVPEWVHNSSVLYLLDIICQHAFVQPICWQEVLRAFSEVMKSPEYQHTGGGGVFALLSWLTAGTTAPNSLLVRPSAPEFPWFTIAVLILETQQEIGSGLWKNLLVELFNQPDIGLEQAVKKVQSDLGLGPVTSSLLSIYRWGQQVVDLPADHPALPLTLQMYFLLHLARVPPQPGKYECCSVVSEFYKGYINSSFLGKIKKKVATCVELLESRVHQQQDQEDEDTPPNPQLGAMARLVRGMQAWLEEERLYEPGVYLPALPPHLLPHHLVQIFQGNWEPWPEAVDRSAIEENSQNFLKVWHQHRNGSGSTSASPSASPQHTVMQECPKKKEQRDHRAAILKRLGTYEPPKPPPAVPPRSPLHTPLLHDKTLKDPDALLCHVLHYTDLVVEHSSAVNMWCKELCALDCVYREVLPRLWFNTNTKMVQTAKCKPPKVGRQQPECCGEASIVLEFSEARLNERENARIEQNREQSEGVVQRCLKPPPLQLCQAAVSLEAIITTLVNRFRKAKQGDSKQTLFQLLTSGRQVFYHIVQLTSEDTSAYPPAKQLITSCAEVLGQEFVSGHGDCQEKLVFEVLEWGGQVGGLLAPHFTPSVTSTATFLSLYASLGRHASVSPDHTFMLLSKFDLENWVSTTQLSTGDCSKLVSSVGAALCSLLPQPQPSLLMVLELYRVHLKSLLNHKFPQHYMEVLNILLQVSASTQEDCGGVSTGLWYDLINSLAMGVTCFTPDMERPAVVQAIRGYAQHQARLSQAMVDDTLKMLSNYFVKQRLEFGLYGLYPKYRLHIKPISVFLCLLSHTYIVTTLHARRGTLQDDAVQKVWRTVEGVWAGWVAPLGGVDRQTCPDWLRHLTHDIQLLLPWAPSDASAADSMVAMFVASIDYIHELLPGQSSMLSLLLEYYSNTFAVREVKSHVLVVVHTHLAALPWHHLHPSLQDTLTMCKVVEQYLPECHSFMGQVLVQVNWGKVLEAALTPPTTTNSKATNTPQSECHTSVGSYPSDQTAAKLHTCLLNLLVRISMEPSVRQSPLLQTLLLESERFAWWLIDGDSFQRVVNWWVMSCDPRIILSLPDRNSVDISIIQLLHRAAGYTSDTTSFHPDTATKRALLVRAAVRLVTTAAARHKALLTARPQVFAATVRAALTHMENTLVATVPKEQQWSEGCVLGTELLAVVSGGASSATLQELSSKAVVEWLGSEVHPSPGLLLPLVASASRSVLHLNHRNPILQAGLLALFSQEWCGWEGEVTWPRVLSLLSFPLTNPAAMLTIACQEGHLLVIYAHTRWRQQQQQQSHTSDTFFLLTSLCDMLPTLVLSTEMEVGLILIISEILKLITKLLHDKSTIESVWQHCQGLVAHLAVWAEDHCTTGILAAIGLGRQSPMSLKFRLICRAVATFLKLQMPQEGVFRTHPLQAHSDVDDLQSTGGGETCTLNQLRALTTNSAYTSLLHPIGQAVQFLEDPGNCLADVHVLLGNLVAELHRDPVLQHLCEAAAAASSASFCEASAPPPP